MKMTARNRTYFPALVFALVLLMLSSVAFADTGPDRFELTGVAPLAAAKSFDVQGGTISLLFAQTVAVAHRPLAGKWLSIGPLTSLRQSYDDCALVNNRLVLYASSSALGLGRIDSDSIVVVSEQTSGDSIFSAALGGDYLYLAHGFNGVEVVNVSDSRTPRTVDRADHGAYYSQVVLHDTLLLAADRLNGIDVFRVRDSVLIYLRTLLTDRPVVDFACGDGAVTICYGSDMIERRPLDGSEGTALTFADRVFALEDFGGSVVIGFDNGILQSFDPQSGTILGSSQLPYPPGKVRSTAENSQDWSCYALDETGNLTGFRGEELTPTDRLMLRDLPEAVVATDRGLVISRAGRGLFLLDFDAGEAAERLLFETGLGFTSLCYQDSLVFGSVANSDSVMVFSLAGTSAELLLVVDISAHGKRLSVHRSGVDTYDLTAISPGGARTLSVDVKSGQVDPRWEITSHFLVNNGYCDGSSLLLSSESGEIDYYCVDCNLPEPLYRASATVSACPRSLMMIGGHFLVVGSETGVTLFDYSQTQELFDLIGGLLPISPVSELVFDPSAHLLVTASGSDRIRYVDLSDPYQPSAVFAISGSGQSTALSLWGDRLYGLEEDAIRCYRFQPEGSPGASGDILASEPYPNPFNSGTVIDVAPSGTSRISYEIFDILGRLVRAGELENAAAGGRIVWDGTDSGHRSVASGVYFLRLGTGESVSVRKMLLIK